jgi:Fur family ferric uptake transcriptional regulator
MMRTGNYKTKQQEAILNYIISLQGAHVTVAQIEEFFKREGITIGRTTIYRHLDKLTESGEVRRYITDGISGACYQYIDNKENCHEHIHLKCEDCEELLHLECETLKEMHKHILNKHSFEINALKTVLYGKCYRCLRRA